MNYYPLYKNEISLLFVKLSVTIKLHSIIFFLIFFCIYLKMTKSAETCHNK